MSELTVYILIASGFSIVLLWLMRPGRHFSESNRSPVDQSLESFLPRHYRFFPQVRRALSDADVQYLRVAAPPPACPEKALRERRAVARGFLFGLREDFSKLERLARMITALSPVISRQQETERLLLSVRFRVLFSMVWLRLSLGWVPLQQIEHLTELVGRLAIRMEHAMAEINALSAERLPRGLSA